jgi:hypothetical protein
MPLEQAARNAPAIEDAIARDGFDRTMNEQGSFVWRERADACAARRGKEATAQASGMFPASEDFEPGPYEETLAAQ